MNLENIYNQCMSILRTQAEEHSIELIGQLEDIEQQKNIYARIIRIYV